MVELQEILGAAALFAIKHAADVFSDRRRDRAQAEQLHGSTDAIQKQLSDNVQTTSKKLLELEHFLIGPDGQNGIRQQVKCLERRFDHFEEREREAAAQAKRRAPRRRSGDA